MKTFRVEAVIRCAVFVQAETEEDAVSNVVDLMEWPGFLLDEEYSATEYDGFDISKEIEGGNNGKPISN